MKYIQGVPTCLPTGREDRRYYSQKPLMITFLPAGRLACRPAVSAEREGGNQLESCLQSGQKSYFSHSLTFFLYIIMMSVRTSYERCTTFSCYHIINNFSLVNFSHSLSVNLTFRRC